MWHFLKIIWRLVVVFGLMSCIQSCSIFQFRIKDAKTYHFFEERGLAPKIAYYTAFNRKMRYLSIGNDSLPTVLLIHGAPSSLNVFEYILSDSVLLAHAKLYAVDRAGYGYSGFGKSEISIERQAHLIKPILDSLHAHHQPIIVLGTSFGGPIACRLAMDYPYLIDGLVLAAPAIAPGEERVYPISYTIKRWWVKWIVPRMLRVANDEKLAHQKELEKMLPFWKNIIVPVIYLQGMEDKLIYTSNATFVRKVLTNIPELEVTMIPRQGHFMTYPQRKLLINSLLRMLDKLKCKN